MPTAANDFPPFNKPVEDDRELVKKIFTSANQGLAQVDFLREISAMLLSFFRCDALELWLEEGGNQNRCEMAGRSFQFQRMPEAKIAKGDLVPADSRLEKLGWDLLLGRVDSYSPKTGSFWIIDPFPLTEHDPETNRSFALTPLFYGSSRIGLLMLKSDQEGFFSGADLPSWDRLAFSLGTALANQKAQAALLERVKELTCLYHIAQVLARSRSGLEEVLRLVVDSLPPAWQYPEIASSRILLDGVVYPSSEFRGGPRKQSAPIIIAEKVRGAVEVYYAAERPEIYEGPFLKEERNLLDTIARQIALSIERREAEEDKARLQEQLRHSDRLATVGQLAAGVAHEMNEPLGNILGFAQLAKKSPFLPAQTEQDLDKIISASLHAREVIRKLMLFSRQMPPGKIRVDLNKVVEEGLYFLRSRCAEQGIDLALDLSPSLPSIEADPTQLTQVLTNYIFKVGVEALMTPVTYAVVRRLKVAEGVDVYDYGTNFNPFKL